MVAERSQHLVDRDRKGCTAANSGADFCTKFAFFSPCAQTRQVTSPSNVCCEYASCTTLPRKRD